MNNLDRDTATVVRQITAQVKSSRPITFTDGVDVALMNKLFAEKRRYVAANKELEGLAEQNGLIQPAKRKKENIEGPIDQQLMNMLFREGAGKNDDHLPPSCSPSPPLIVPQFQPVSKAPSSTKRPTSCLADDILRLQKEALEAQIAKDRVLTEYYRKKSELLDKKMKL